MTAWTTHRAYIHILVLDHHPDGCTMDAAYRMGFNVTLVHDVQTERLLRNVSEQAAPHLASSGWGFSLVQRYDSTLPDWQKRSDDRYFTGDINGDGKADPLIYTDQGWSTQSLGRMIWGGHHARG